MKKMNELTATQKKNRYRGYQYLAFGGEILSVLTPYIVLGAVNFDAWFTNNPEGWKVGLGGSLALALCGIATFLVSKKKEDEKITNGFIALIVGWFMVAFIFMLLASIMNEIATIMFYGGLGLMGAFGLDMVSKSNKNKADMYKEAIKKVRGEKMEDEVRKEIEQEVLREDKKKKVAVD